MRCALISMIFLIVGIGCNTEYLKPDKVKVKGIKSTGTFDHDRVEIETEWKLP